jgi:hypothetical protein
MRCLETKHSPNATDDLFVAESLLSAVTGTTFLSRLVLSREEHETFYGDFKRVETKASLTSVDNPHSLLMTPVLSKFDDSSSDIVGFLLSVVPFDSYLDDLLPDSVTGIHLVVRNTCQQAFTYELTGNRVSEPTEGT